MANSKATLALIALLAASVSVPVLAKDKVKSGHSSAGARAHAGHAGPHRTFTRGPRIVFLVGAPVFAAPLFYPRPRYYYPSPPPTYIELPSQPSWYFCPDANGYYPQVQECPGGWQQVLPAG